jgi:hypothetical protein
LEGPSECLSLCFGYAELDNHLDSKSIKERCFWLIKYAMPANCNVEDLLEFQKSNKIQSTKGSAMRIRKVVARLAWRWNL